MSSVESSRIEMVVVVEAVVVVLMVWRLAGCADFQSAG